MHLSWDISLGQIVTLIGLFTPLAGVLIWLMRIDHKMSRFMIEHEILIGDYTKRNGMEPGDLPTRRKF